MGEGTVPTQADRDAWEKYGPLIFHCEMTGPEVLATVRLSAIDACALPSDVVRLVIAARIVAYEDQSPKALHELDKAAEAFAERVPWDNDPENLP